MAKRLWKLLAAIPLAGGAHAAERYPVKPVRLIVPYPVGGSVDLLARMLAPRMTEALGQSVVVDNRGGAGGIIGTTIVAKAAPDGYTALLVYDTFAVSPYIYKNLPYDIFNDLAPVTQVMSTPLVFLGSPKLQADTIKELVALAKARPGTLKYATGSTGSSSHLTPELFKLRAGIDIGHVLYKGAGPALTALMVGDAHVTVLGTIIAVPQVKGGRLKGLAVASMKRAPQLPSVPTLDESGYPNFEAIAWYGLLLPARTPAPIVERLRQAAIKAINQPDMAAQLNEQSADIVTSTPAQFATFLRAESAKWGKVIREAKIKLN